MLARLLTAHERSVYFGRPGPWAREVILKLDSQTFPRAFAPDGREQRAAMYAAARELESEGCVRVVRQERGPLAGEPREIRLGPGNVDRAYAAAREGGYEPLAVGLGEVGRHALDLAQGEVPSWLREFLETLAAGARAADLSSVGMKRERFKKEWRGLVKALSAAAALATGIAPAWERIASERIFGDSKVLGDIRPLVVAVLLRADPRWEGVEADEASDPLETYGVRRKPGLIRCAGAAPLRVGSVVYRLDDFVPVAHLPEAWAESWIDGVVSADVRTVTTVENEYPFLAYVEGAGGPARLGARGEVVVYTAGFPTPQLASTLGRLAERSPDATFRHWGDADVGGVRIWWLLRTRLGRPLELFRTTREWVEAESSRSGKPLSQAERHALARLHDDLEQIEGGDVVAARELIDVILAAGRKLEQERY